MDKSLDFIIVVKANWRVHHSSVKKKTRQCSYFLLGGGYISTLKIKDQIFLPSTKTNKSYKRLIRKNINLC